MVSPEINNCSHFLFPFLPLFLPFLVSLSLSLPPPQILIDSQINIEIGIGSLSYRDCRVPKSVANKMQTQGNPEYNSSLNGKTRQDSCLSGRWTGEDGQLLGRRNSHLWEDQPFCSICPSTNWVRAMHIKKDNLLYSVNEFNYQAYPKISSWTHME